MENNKTIVINKIENYKGYVIIEENGKYHLSRICKICGSFTSTQNKGYEKWYKYKNGLICHICYRKNNNQ